MVERGVAVVVLAGGEGRRIGGDKPQRQLGDASLMERAVAFARTQGSPIAAAVKHASQVDSTVDLAIVLDEERYAGPIGGLAAGLRWARSRGSPLLLTIPCDAPFLPGDLVSRLREKLEQSGRSVAMPTSLGRLHPACGLWRTTLGDRLARYAADGGASLRGFADFIGYVTAEWAGGPPDPFFNVNTPQDLEAARSLQPHLE